MFVEIRLDGEPVVGFELVYLCSAEGYCVGSLCEIPRYEWCDGDEALSYRESVPSGSTGDEQRSNEGVLPMRTMKDTPTSLAATNDPLDVGFRHSR